MTSHRLTDQDVTAIVEEKNKLVRENYQLRLMVANLRLGIEQYKKALRFTDPPQPLTYEQRAAYACDVCGNVPDEDGMIEHGRGCFVASEDGGGTSFVDMGEER